MTKDERKRYLILKDGNIYKGLIVLAIPLMLNNLLKTFHDIIDMFFVSRIPGESAQAVSAIQLTFPVIFTFLSLGIGLSVAGTALISQQLGSGQRKEAKKYASELFAIALVLGLVLNVVSYIFAPAIVGLMGAEGYVLENSIAYLRIRSFELPLLFVFFAFMATRQAAGDTLTPVLVSGSAVLLNLILSPIFIMVLGYGVVGAAYATLIANAVMLPIGFYKLFYSKTGITVDLKLIASKFSSDGEPLLVGRFESMVHIIRTAIPASFGQAITAIGFGVMNAIILSYGVETVAAFGIGNRLTSMILHPVMAIGGVLSAYIGQNIGALNPSRAKETFKKAMILSVVSMAIGSAVLLVFRGQLAGLFLQNEPEALQLTKDYMFYLLIGLPLMGVFQTFIGTYNGTGNTHFTFWLSVARLWLMRVPLVLLLGYFLPHRGSSVIWEAMLISNFLIAIVGTLLYKRIDFQPKIRVRKEKHHNQVVYKTS